MTETTRMLDRLYVASPCSTDWEAMAGNDQTRFCDHCELYVYNISAMTKTQVQELIAETEGRLCTRLFRRADGTIITRDCPVGMRAMRRHVSRAAGAVLGTILSVFTTQTMVWADHNNCSHYKGKVIKLESPDDSTSIQGTVYYMKDEALVDADVTLTSEQTKRQYVMKTNDKGRFEFSALPPGRYSISIWSPGFVTFKKRNMTAKARKGFQLNVMMQVGMTGGAALLPATPDSDLPSPTRPV